MRRARRKPQWSRRRLPGGPRAAATRSPSRGACRTCRARRARALRRSRMPERAPDARRRSARRAEERSFLVSEVIEAAAMRNRLALGIQYADPRRACLDRADARERELELGRERFDLAALRERRGEGELVVVAAGEHAALLELFVFQLPENARPRYPLVLHLGRDARALADMPEIARQPIRNVDRGARELAQPLAELDARLRRVQALRGLRDLRMHEPERRAAELAGDPEVVAGARARALERHAGRDFAERGNAADAKVGARRVAADEIEVVALGQG